MSDGQLIYWDIVGHGPLDNVPECPSPIVQVGRYPTTSLLQACSFFLYYSVRLFQAVPTNIS
ncbi:9436_t:CDS:2 [Funneliformis mosseae]|uniref:9436_t:CDS:1 n=1 Tax=Funneliformis mosseae TaxID=27381 RepID=A0A9N9E673_FUNMO|nr:9436_t:CDS:2 [Funneliformis mosseae]